MISFLLAPISPLHHRQSRIPVLRANLLDVLQIEILLPLLSTTKQAVSSVCAASSAGKARRVAHLEVIEGRDFDVLFGLPFSKMVMAILRQGCGCSFAGR